MIGFFLTIIFWQELVDILGLSLIYGPITIFL